MRPERHVLVDGPENLRGGLDQRDRHTEARELLDHLESDVAGADHGGVPRPNPAVPLDHGIHVGNGTKGEVADATDTGNRRAQRSCARSQDEVVVSLRVDLVRVEVADLDMPGFTVDAERLVASANVEIEPVLQALRSLDQQALAVLDLPTDVEREPAVRIRDEAASFDHDDVRLFRQPAGSGGNAGAPGDPADDDDLLAWIRHGNERYGQRTAISSRGSDAPNMPRPEIALTECSEPLSHPARRRAPSEAHRPSVLRRCLLRALRKSDGSTAPRRRVSSCGGRTA